MHLFRLCRRSFLKMTLIIEYSVFAIANKLLCAYFKYYHSDLYVCLRLHALVQVNLELNVNLVDDGDPMRTILLNRNDVRDVVAVRRDVEQDGSRHGGLQMPPHRANGDERRWTSELSSNGYSDPPAHWRQLVNT